MLFSFVQTISSGKNKVSFPEQELFCILVSPTTTMSEPGPAFIRPFSETDADDLVEAVRESYAEVSPWMVWCRPDYSNEHAATWIRATIAGRAPAAVLAVAEWTFANTHLNRLEIVVAVGNTRSQRVAQKVGACREAVLRQRIMVGGIPSDAVMYSLVRPTAIGSPAA